MFESDFQRLDSRRKCVGDQFALLEAEANRNKGRQIQTVKDVRLDYLEGDGVWRDRFPIDFKRWVFS